MAQRITKHKVKVVFEVSEDVLFYSLPSISQDTRETDDDLLFGGDERYVVKSYHS